MDDFRSGPKQITRRTTIGSLEALAVAVADRRYEASLQRGLADQLARAGVTYLGPTPPPQAPSPSSTSDGSAMPMWAGAAAHKNQQGVAA